MKKTIFFLIGNRHILYQGQELPKDCIREESLRLLEQYETERKHITLQIVNPLIEKLKQEIQEIVLIVTDQGKSAYSKQDTLFIGEIVRHKINELYGIRDVALKKYEASPVELEDIFPYITRLIKQYEHDGTKKIICNSGGTPQMKQALLLLATNLLKPDEVEAYQVDEKSGRISPIELASTIRSEFVKRSCLELIKSYEYSAAVKLVMENQFQTKKILMLLALLNYGKYRLSFDFDSANKNLDSLSSGLLASIEYDDFKKFKMNIQTRLEKILELHNNLLIQWQKESYVDFIARLFRFEEEVYYLLVEKEYQGKFNLAVDRDRKKFIKFLKSNDSLLTRLQGKMYRGSPIEIKIISTPLLFYLVDDLQKFDDILNCFNKLGRYQSSDPKPSNNQQARKSLDWLRNKSIAAHGFAPVSREIIEKLYGEPIDNLFHDLQSILNAIKTDQSNIANLPSFDELNSEIKKIILDL